MQAWRSATLFKKRLWHRCFAVNFAEFLKTPFLTEHLWETASRDLKIFKRNFSSVQPWTTDSVAFFKGHCFSFFTVGFVIVSVCFIIDAMSYLGAFLVVVVLLAEGRIPELCYFIHNVLWSFGCWLCSLGTYKRLWNVKWVYFWLRSHAHTRLCLTKRKL